MTGSMISIIVITAAFAMLAFIVAFILSYTLGASKIETDKRMEELKKQEGYVQGRYLLKYNQEAGSKLKERLTSDYPLYYVVNCEGHANMYRRRNSSSKVIAKVEFGYRVRLLEKGRNNYYKVAYRNKIGYIESKYLSKYKHEK